MVAIFHEFTVPSAMRPSPTMSAGKLADAAKARGKSVEMMTIGDLFPKPPEAEVNGWLAALYADAKKPENSTNPTFKTLRDPSRLYAYSETGGLPSLRAAVAETFLTDTGMTVTADDVCVGTGGKGALNGALCVFKPGDVVFLAAPGWPTNYDMFPAGVKLIEIATKDGIMRAEDFKAAKAKYGEPAGVLINAPSNPTGANYTPAEREAFFTEVKNTTEKTLVVNDDPYGKLVFDRPIETALRRGANEKAVFEAGRQAVFRTISKEYGLAGERVGYVVSKNAGMVKSLQLWNESKGGGMGVENQLKAQAALMYGDGFIRQTVETLSKKRKMMIDGIAALNTASVDAPAATIYGWVDFSGLSGATVPASLSETGEAYSIDSPAAMMRYLVNVAGVCCVPGAPFYAPDSPAAQKDWHVRMTFCGEEKSLATALANLKEAESQLEGVKKNNPTVTVGGVQTNGTTLDGGNVKVVGG